MKRLLFAFALCLFSGLLFADLATALAYFNAKTDKDPLTYETGEKMVFTFHFGEYGKDIPNGTKIVWLRTGDDGKVEGGDLLWDCDKPATFETSLSVDGFVRIQSHLENEKGKNLCDANGHKVSLESGAGVHPERLQGVPEPEDFDAYWAKQKELLKTVPLTYSLTKVVAGNGFDIYAVSIACPGPRPVTGFLSIPTDATAKSLPATCNFMGYNYHRDLFTRIPQWNVTDRILLEINAHGAELLREDAYYEEFGNGIRTDVYSYAFNPLENMDPDKAYFHGMVLRVLRALEFLKALPQWNGKDLLVQGGSQGGLQTIWAAALDHDVTLALPSCPWCCDLAGQSAFGRIFGGWRIPYVPGLDYYDCINMAKRIQCPVEITRAGLGDYVCPPSGVAILYNNLNCPKKINWYQGSTHGFVPKNPEIFVRQEKYLNP